MPSIHSTIKRLRLDFPEFQFKLAGEYWWSATTRTIYIDPQTEHNQEFTLHELSHALLGHKGYERDIELLKLERDAWEYAKDSLADRYGISIDMDIIQDNLDTYRQWLHARSSCPKCEAIGVQTRDSLYRCVSCGHGWRVNEARLCALRRYSLQTK
ncbi:MAG: ImmA/IrrE family metallo-endopeptidase [Candidatus Nomurabacteria bacterium]|nr:MAG: ImmA/IrrE family metallo-endopeptidase [Candidatus Nomurabacteria bacterium]